MKTGHMSQEVNPRSTLAKNLKVLRTHRGWTQEDLAYEAQMDRSFLATVERGRSNVSLDTLSKLAQAFGLQVHELLTPLVLVGEQQAPSKS